MDKLSIGIKVEHKLSGNWLTLLAIEENKVLCRTKDFKIVELFDWEIKPVKEVK